MVIDLNIFKEIIQIVKANTFQNVVDSLDSLRAHRELVKEDYEFQMKELKHMFVHYKKYESQMNFRVQGINFSQIQPWIPLLKKHQMASVYPDVKKATVVQITEAKKELDSIGFSLEELRYKITKQGKETKLAANAVLKIEAQIFVLETAVDVDTFFETSRYNVREIADFEVKKYYDIYREGRA
jgi:hypothetical protein